jgi:hypothetical protein
MIKRTLLLITLLTAGNWFPAQAEDTNAVAATNAAPSAAAPADTAPKPDPAGTATGASSDAQDAAGNHFVGTEPTALSADDKKDAAKVKTYEEAKKAYADYLAQAKIEPLAVKLSDSRTRWAITGWQSTSCGRSLRASW